MPPPQQRLPDYLGFRDAQVWGLGFRIFIFLKLPLVLQAGVRVGESPSLARGATARCPGLGVSTLSPLRVLASQAWF